MAILSGEVDRTDAVAQEPAPKKLGGGFRMLTHTTASDEEEPILGGTGLIFVDEAAMQIAGIYFIV